MRGRLFKAAAALLLTATSVAPSSGHAQTAPAAAAIDGNVVYGMVGGLALLMDVHRPVKPKWTRRCRHHRDRLASRAGLRLSAR